MMALQVNYKDATSRLRDLIEAASRGEKVFISKDDQLVQLVPVPRVGSHRRFGSAKGLIVMADDFDAPLQDFAEYMA